MEVNIMRNQRGQIMVEFALCIMLFLLFVFGLITMTLWTVVSYWTQETAHEVARQYAVQASPTVAIEFGKEKMSELGKFIDNKQTQIQVSIPPSPRQRKAVRQIILRVKASLGGSRIKCFITGHGKMFP